MLYTHCALPLAHPRQQQNHGRPNDHAAYRASGSLRHDNGGKQGRCPMRRGLRFKASGRHEKSSRDNAANERVGKVAKKKVPRRRKRPAQEKDLRQSPRREGQQAHDQNDYETRCFHCSTPHPRVAIAAAAVIEPHPGFVAAAGTASSRLARQTIRIVQPRISTISSPAK
jgi:hypothetical protein